MKILILKDMWLFIRKWWVLEQLRKAISHHTSFASLDDISRGGAVLITEHFFIVGKENYPGIAEKAVKRFSKILCWREKIDEKKLKKRINEYYNMFKTLVADQYITIVKAENGMEVPTIVNPKADNIHGIMGLLQALLLNYLLAWTI